jgi:hypothetical protein
MKPAGGSCAITFALIVFDTTAAERNTPRLRAGGEQPAFGAPARPGFDADKAK